MCNNVCTNCVRNSVCDDLRNIVCNSLTYVCVPTLGLCLCRDLKLDNTLLCKGDPPIVKLCDFGFAKDWVDPMDMQTHIG